MSTVPAKPPADRRALVAIDLGAESFRVSLLRWQHGSAAIELLHRFPNVAREHDGGLRWDMQAILTGLHAGLELCAATAPEGIRSIAVDGWAVDYVRLNADGERLGDPFCYRDPRTAASEPALHARLSAERMRELTGIQLLPLNTAYQMAADDEAMRALRWLNLPEYVLYTLGARPAAEFTNATHTQLVATDGQWSPEILAAVGAPSATMPPIVPAGTRLGKLKGPLAQHAAFADTQLIAPCCHDTASAIAAIADDGDDWAYISSGTWSLVGALLPAPDNSAAARAQNFTNLGGADNKICFHKNVNGMWLLRHCLETWNAQVPVKLSLPPLLRAAATFPRPAYLLDVDDPDLLLPGDMPARINTQLGRRGLPLLDPSPAGAPQLVAFLLHSLAARYAEVLASLSTITGKRLRRLHIMGGGSQNELLNQLTAQATGLVVLRAGTECSTLGNFAVQLSALESGSTASWAALLQAC